MYSYVLYGISWTFYGLLWQTIDLIGLVSSFLAVMDPNSFRLVSFASDFHFLQKLQYTNYVLPALKTKALTLKVFMKTMLDFVHYEV